eukprot:4004916-Amphidinium_carterae.1
MLWAQLLYGPTIKRWLGKTTQRTALSLLIAEFALTGSLTGWHGLQVQNAIAIATCALCTEVERSRYSCACDLLHIAPLERSS